MNRLLCIIALVFVVGCGSSGVGPLFGGFVPTGGSALIFAPVVCTIASVGSTAISGIALDFTSYTDSCEVLNQTQMCGTKASSTRVLAAVVNGDVGGASIDPAGPGTYSYLTDPPTGTFKAIIGQAAQVNDSCQASSGVAPAISGGSITISSVSEINVVGTANIRFDNGQVFEHSFDVPLCAGTIDLCARFSSCANRICVP